MTTPEQSYRTIPLTQGQVAIVDDGDYEWLSQWKWSALWERYTRSFYATRNEGGRKNQRTVRMHRRILGLEYKDGKEGDHINGNTLDNRRSNLRIVTHLQNSWNRRGHRDNRSGVKGVHQHPKTLRWRARLNVKGKRIHLGYFKDKMEAHAAHSEALKVYHGDFARLN